MKGTHSALKLFSKGCPKKTEFCGGSDFSGKTTLFFVGKSLWNKALKERLVFLWNKQPGRLTKWQLVEKPKKTCRNFREVVTKQKFWKCKYILWLSKLERLFLCFFFLLKVIFVELRRIFSQLFSFSGNEISVCMKAQSLSTTALKTCKAISKIAPRNNARISVWRSRPFFIFRRSHVTKIKIQFSRIAFFG
jgi:hypothetical protein